MLDTKAASYAGGQLCRHVRVYLQSLQVYPCEKYMDASRPTYAAPLPRTTPYRLLPGPVRYLRRATPAQVRAPYHVLPLWPMRVLRRLRRSGGRGMPMAVRTMRLRCVLLQDRGGAWRALLRSQSAHCNDAAQQAGGCQQGPMLPHARIVQRGPAYTGFLDMRLFELEAICENCLA